MQARSQNNILVVLVVLALFIPAGLQSQSPDAGMLSGYAEFQKGNLGKALDNFSNAISRNNADERLFISRGRIFMQMRDYEHAIADFNEANDIIPGIANLWLAKAYALSGDQKKAISMLKDHLSSDYRVAEDSIKKDPSFSSLHTSPEWLDLWQKEWYNEEEKAAAEIKYYLKKGSDEQALTYLDEQIAKSPLSSGMLALRGKVNLDRGNYPAAISDYTSSLNLAKKGQTAGAGSRNPEGSLYYNRGLAYLGAEKFKEALSDLNKALREFPEFFNGYLVRSKAYAGMKSYDMAVKDVLFYLNYFGDDQQAVFTCGNYYYLSGDYMNALKYFNINLKEDPVNGQYFKARGKTYLKTGTYKYAINDLSMALDLNPDDAETWMYLGIAKMESGDRENACSDFEKARQLGNNEVLKYVVENCK
jgi:tetratricopeptide (TPR) repeat protein